jgi:hypothetical protein
MMHVTSLLDGSTRYVTQLESIATLLRPYTGEGFPSEEETTWIRFD